MAPESPEEFVEIFDMLLLTTTLVDVKLVFAVLMAPEFELMAVASEVRLDNWGPDAILLEFVRIDIILEVIFSLFD